MALEGGLSLSHIVGVLFREFRTYVKVPPIDGFSHVSCTGINTAAYKYLMEFYLPLNWCTWLLWFVDISRLCRGNLHKPVSTSLVPCNITCSYFVTAMLWWLKLSSNLELHNSPMYIREICANLGSMCTSLASSGKAANFIWQPLVECRIGPFGCFTWIGATVRDVRSWGVSAFRYCPEAPMS